MSENNLHHNEKATYCSCMDGRPALTQAMLDCYSELCDEYGQVFRLSWGGGPLLFLLPEWKDFARQQLELSYKVNPIESFHGDLHMGCGAYAALASRTFESREEEVAAKWLDAAAIEETIHSYGLGIEVNIGLIDLDGTRLKHPAEFTKA